MKKEYKNPEMSFELFSDDVIALSFGGSTGDGGEIGWGDLDLDALSSGPVGDKYVAPVGYDEIVKPD